MCCAAETRSYFRSGCRTASRLPVPSVLPMIREDDDDIPTVRSPASPPALLERLQKLSRCVQKIQCDRATVPSAGNAELIGCTRHAVCTSTKHEAPPASTSKVPSLLDAMHKKYCASQYARRQAPPSTSGCHGNTHLFNHMTPTTLIRLRPSADCSNCDRPIVNHFVTRETETVEPVSGDHATSSGGGDCDDSRGASDVITRCSAASAVRVTSSPPNTAGIDDEEELEDDDSDSGDGENGELRNVSEQNEAASLYDHQPWKERYCDCCHDELEVKPKPI